MLRNTPVLERNRARFVLLVKVLLLVIFFLGFRKCFCTWQDTAANHRVFKKLAIFSQEAVVICTIASVS